MVIKDNTFNLNQDIQAVTFDAVGTLIVPHPSVGEIYAKELKKFGYDLSPNQLENNFIKAFQQFKIDQPDALLNRDSWRTIVAGALLGLTSSNDFDSLFEALWNGFANPRSWSILPGVEETLHRLHSDGLHLFVLSNNDQRLHGILHGLPIGQYFEEIFVSSELGAEKPARRIFEFVQARIQVAAENILHVGDNPVEDVQGALGAGWHAALVGPYAKISGPQINFKQAGSIDELFYNN